MSAVSAASVVSQGCSSSSMSRLRRTGARIVIWNDSRMKSRSSGVASWAQNRRTMASTTLRGSWTRAERSARIAASSESLGAWFSRIASTSSRLPPKW